MLGLIVGAVVALAVIVTVVVIVVISSTGKGTSISHVEMLIDRRRKQNSVPRDKLLEAMSLLETIPESTEPLHGLARHLAATVFAYSETASSALDDIQRRFQATPDSQAVSELEAELVKRPIRLNPAAIQASGAQGLNPYEALTLHDYIRRANQRWVTLTIVLDLLNAENPDWAMRALVSSSLTAARALLKDSQSKGARNYGALQRHLGVVDSKTASSDHLGALEDLAELHRLTASVRESNRARRPKANKRKQRGRTTAWYDNPDVDADYDTGDAGYDASETSYDSGD